MPTTVANLTAGQRIVRPARRRHGRDVVHTVATVEDVDGTMVRITFVESHTTAVVRPSATVTVV